MLRPSPSPGKSIMSSGQPLQLEKKLEGFSLTIAPSLLSASIFFWNFWNKGEYGLESAMLIVFSIFLWILALVSHLPQVKRSRLLA